MDRLTDAIWYNNFGINTTNHQRIYNRETYEQYGVLPQGSDDAGLWGYGKGDVIRPAINSEEQLYLETRCGCNAQ